jgi:hypothetical protein
MDKDTTEQLIEETTKPALVTNRRKAVVFANLYMLFHFGYFCCAKVSMSLPYNVNAVDLCLVRTMVVSAFNVVEIG